jgi:hypothetical protein
MSQLTDETGQADETFPDESAVDEAPSRPTVRSAGLLRVDAVALMVVLASVAVIAAGVLGVRVLVQRHDRHDSAVALTHEDATRAAVEKAAAADITAFSTFDYLHLPADEARAKAVLTPAFGARYATTIGALETTVKQRKATITVSTPMTQTLDLTGASKATALVFFDQTGSYGDGGPKKTTSYRLEMSLVLSNGKWLADDLQFLQ